MIIITRVKKPLSPTLGLIWSFTVFLFIYLISHPQSASAAVTSSLTLCATRLIPSLFPFMVLTDLICSSGLADLISRVIGRPFSRATGLPESGASAFLLGSLGGFPVGAVAAKRLLERGAITVDDAARLIAFSNNAGMAFCVGAVGSMYGGIAVGWKLWGIQLFSAILLAVLTADRGQVSKNVGYDPVGQISSPELMSVISGSVTNAAMSIIKVCAFAVFFGTVGDVICGILPLLPACAVSAFLELTLAARLSASLDAGLPICAFALGFAGLSVHAQVAAILEGSEVKMRRFFLSKLAQGVISALIAVIFC